MRNGLLALLALAVLASCQTDVNYDYSNLVTPAQSYPASAFRKSIHHSNFTVNPLVTNGVCYEQFQITIPNTISTIVLPPGTATFRIDGTSLAGHVKKTLMWTGHPDKPVSIDKQRARMGAAMKIAGRTLHIISYGGSESFEGGSGTTMIAGVPHGLAVRVRKTPPRIQPTEELTKDGWYKIPSKPALKKDYDRNANTARQ